MLRRRDLSGSRLGRRELGGCRLKMKELRGFKLELRELGLRRSEHGVACSGLKKLGCCLRRDSAVSARTEGAWRFVVETEELGDFRLG